ncbi:MAG: SGNH/GDSL hydrolase family protein [Marinifilaceae bacterium]
MKKSLFLFWVLPMFIHSVAFCEQKIKVACVGNSITFGSGIANREKNSYPAQLQYRLGSEYEVRNFGVSGSTALKMGDRPYVNTPEYGKSLAFLPDVVLLKLGTNDSKSHNFKHAKEFKESVRSLVESYKQLPTSPRVVLITPLRCYRPEDNGISNKRIREYYVPLLEQLALECGVEIFDGYSLFGEEWNGALFPDKLHPSALGATVMADQLSRYLQFERDSLFTVSEKLEDGTLMNFHGFTGVNFMMGDVACKIVAPKVANKHKGWVLRARFWGHEPQFDIKMLELGYHVAYCDVADLYGCPQAVERWNSFYQLMTKLGLNKKVVLEGMSRGGLIVYNWAVKNRDKVSAIYADAPVMDVKSWPAGKGAYGGSQADMEQAMKVYGWSDVDLMEWDKNPVDHARKLAKSKTPILHVVGMTDNVVPVAENTALFKERLEAAGGSMELICKENVGHHPHSLKAPEAIVRFVLKAEGLYVNPCMVAVPGSEYRQGAGWTKGAEWHTVAMEIEKVLTSKNPRVMMLGNSITQATSLNRTCVTHKVGVDAFGKCFPGFDWESAGISGDKVANLLWRVQQPAYKEVSPEYVVISIGVNDLLANAASANEVYEGIVQLTKLAGEQYPNAKVLTMGLLPCTANERVKGDYMNIQSRLRKTKFAKNITHIDPTTYFMDEDLNLKPGLYSGDRIHLTAKGYEQWGQLLKEYVN